MRSRVDRGRRPLTFSADGRTAAYAETTTGGELDRGAWCDVYYARIDALASAQPVYHSDGACRIGLAIVGDALWLISP